ncbi:MAG: hypothetical protein M3Q14_01570 [bacterium]|nr:hypothetical protein [bacterium]
MIEHGSQPHPLAGDINVISEAFKSGIAEELPYWGLIKGYDVNVLPGDSSDEGSTYMRMEYLGGRSMVEYQLAPPESTPNPLVVIEASEDGDIVAKPVMARMVVSSNTLLFPIGTKDGLPLKASSIQVDVLEEGAVIALNESLGIQPFSGEFDDNSYRFICKKSYGELRLGEVAAFAREYLAAA